MIKKLKIKMQCDFDGCRKKRILRTTDDICREIGTGATPEDLDHWLCDRHTAEEEREFERWTEELGEKSQERMAGHIEELQEGNPLAGVSS